MKPAYEFEQVATQKGILPGLPPREIFQFPGYVVIVNAAVLGWSVRLHAESLQQKLVRDDRGGYCFEQNLLL